MRGRSHLCAAPGCPELIRGKHPLCGVHFFALSVQHRMAILTAQQADPTFNTPAYRATVQAAIASLADARKATA